MSNVPPVAWFPAETSSNSNGRILLTAILSLIFVVIVVVFLHLYVRYILLRHRSTLRAPTTTLRRVTISTTPEPPKSAGLDPSAIAALPTFPFRRTDDTWSECTVCLSVLEESEMVRLLPSCKHVFHVGCIDMWLHSHSTCPVCRTGAESPVVTATVEPGEASAPAQEGASGRKERGSVSRLSSFRRMLSGERSGRRVQGDQMEDLERQ